MLVTILVLALASGTDTGIYASFGVAAPTVGIMYAFMRSSNASADKRVAAAETRADKAEKRSEELTERLITQQATVLPLLTEAAAVIRATGAR